MKKLIPFAALLLTAAGSWAFYPKAEAPTGYMMVISRFSGTGFGGKINIATISPDGQVQNQEIEAKVGSVNKINSSLDQLHLAELKKINELQQQGWRVVTTNSLNMPVAYETTVLMEKK